MSEQKTSFMQELDAWTDKVIVEPLTEGMLDARWRAIATARPQVGTGTIRKERSHCSKQKLGDLAVWFVALAAAATLGLLTKGGVR